MKIDISNFLFTGRGSSALYSILKSLDVSKKNILLPVNICEIVYPVVIKAGFTPVFYDVNGNTGNATLSTIKAAYLGNETVLLAAHNFGISLEIDEILNWTKANNIFLIEDVCNALGAVYKNKLLGTWGDAAIFSFGYVKIIEHGIGGAAIVKEPMLKKKVWEIMSSFENYSDLHKEKNDFYQSRIREIRQQNLKDKTNIYSSLYNEYSNYLFYKIDEKDKQEIIDQFSKLEDNLKQRDRNAYRYRSEINSNKLKHIDNVEGQIYWRYNMLVDSDIRENLITSLRKNNILVSTWYPPIIEFFIEHFDKKKYTGAYQFSKKVVNLFVDYRVSESDISKTIKLINKF